MSRDRAALLNIATAARFILAFTTDQDRVSFLQDAKTQSAVLHQLMVLGEAVKRLSPEFRARYPDRPWSQMAGMRDRLIHKYEEVDLELVWRTVVVEIPALLAFIEPLLSDEPLD